MLAVTVIMAAAALLAQGTSAQNVRTGRPLPLLAHQRQPALEISKDTKAREERTVGRCPAPMAAALVGWPKDEIPDVEVVARRPPDASPTAKAPVWCSDNGSAPPANGGPRKIRVRSEDRVLMGLITRASLGSATFARLLTTIESTNGIVYVEVGKCSHGGVRACLQMWMHAAGGNRFLRVRVDRHREDSDLDVMASIGHELQHAIEALSEASIINGRMLYNFFRRYAPTDGPRFETTAAVTIGDAVSDELHASERRARQDLSAGAFAAQGPSAHHVRTTDRKIQELFDAG